MIVEGLRNGVKRGKSLKQAMISFYNAGYSRQDIEESARVLQSQMQSVQSATPSQTPQNIKSSLTNSTPQSILKNQSQNISSSFPQNFSQQNYKTPPRIIQKPSVSSYSYPYKKENFFESSGLVIFLSVFLVLCLGGLASVLFFKEELINFFNNLIK